MLIGREISSPCFARDHVELNFDGAVRRAFANPWGRHGCVNWRFPHGTSPTVMRYFVGMTIDECELIPGRFLAVDSGEHRFAVPLDAESRPGPEAAHLRTETGQVWIW
ncbi:hypothetical protein [Amycolatopsis sp. NPDC051903]|uniref:hypothetical protein n=1 Tax=Amycolatopsis sp. NPDC051903 TaxID=3363936 RepID=UPI0037AED5C6